MHKFVPLKHLCVTHIARFVIYLRTVIYKWTDRYLYTFCFTVAAAPSLVDICNELEASKKPVVAAVHGTALGGGCEIVISCHYRVVHEQAR